MKRKNLVFKNVPTIKGIEVDPTTKYRKLSYYLDGGIDLTGEALKKDGHVEYDDEKSTTPKVIKQSDGSFDYSGLDSCALCDPRISHFDIVEKLGADNAQKAFAKMETPIVEEPSDEVIE